MSPRGDERSVEGREPVPGVLRGIGRGRHDGGDQPVGGLVRTAQGIDPALPRVDVEGAAQRSGHHGPERDDVVQDEGLGQRARQRLARSDPLLDQPVLHDPAEPAQLVDELVVVTRRPRLGKGPSDVALPEFAETGSSGQFGEALQVLGEGAIAGIGAEGEAARSVLAEGRHEQR